MADDEVKSLFKRPGNPGKSHVSSYQSTLQGLAPMAIQQADLLQLPTDGGYSHALVVVDLATLSWSVRNINSERTTTERLQRPKRATKILPPAPNYLSGISWRFQATHQC